LQQAVEIPNSVRRSVVSFPNLESSAACNALKSPCFMFWHGSCSVKGKNFCQLERTMEAQENQVALPLRSHTILGVCEAIGEDFGFNPTFLRIPFAASVLYSPIWAIGTYLALGMVVLASRLIFPKPKSPEPQKRSDVDPANEQQEFARAA
jgi:phage shock protein PspC (stress-responsive transcriptional regulator)